MLTIQNVIVSVFFGPFLLANLDEYVYLPQIPSDPIHRGALSFRAAASDGTHLQRGVWRQTAI